MARRNSEVAGLPFAGINQECAAASHGNVGTNYMIATKR